MVDEVLRNQFHPLIAIVSKNREGRYFNLWNRILAVVLSCIGVVPEDESVNSYETSLVSVPADCRRGKSGVVNVAGKTTRIAVIREELLWPGDAIELKDARHIRNPQAFHCASILCN